MGFCHSLVTRKHLLGNDKRSKRERTKAKQQAPVKTPRVRLSLRKKIVFSVVVAIAFFSAIEFGLRAIGFQSETRVERMEFTFPVDDYNKSAPQRYLQRDDTLFWKPIAGVLGHDSKGFYGPEFSTQKPTGVYRIVCLGDSCTHFGPVSYPDILRGALEKVAPGRFEVINASCIGYSSFQGRTILESQALSWSPDLVTVYFGWNDHWLARGVEDKDQVAPQVTSGVLDGLRTFQFARYLKSGGTTAPANIMRVQPGDYADNLNHVGAQCATINAETWYITAPHALDLGIPPYLHSSGEITHPKDLIPLHRKYNSIVRDVAKKRGAYLIDLESEMDQLDKSQLFIEDHIHLSQEGRMYLVKHLFDSLKQRGVLSVSESE